MDNLARSAMLAKQKGMSYGRYQALYGKPVAKQEESTEDVDFVNLRNCQWCGKQFKKKPRTGQKYCSDYCREEAMKQRKRDKVRAERMYYEGD